MLALALAPLALAAPPDGVDLDDLDLWEARARDVLAGPVGCWVLEGNLELAYTVYTPPSLFSRAEKHTNRSGGTFVGRFVDGKWTAFDYTLDPIEGDKDGQIEVPVRPMMGKYDASVVQRVTTSADEQPSYVSIRDGGGGGGAEAMSLLDRAIDLIDPDSSTAYAQWDDEAGGVRLIQDVPMTDFARSDTLTITTLFPGGGPLGTRVDAEFPRRVRGGNKIVHVSLYDAQMHLRGQIAGGVVLPAKESVSMGIGALGFTLGYEQSLTYTRAVGCTGAEAAPAEVTPEPE